MAATSFYGWVPPTVEAANFSDCEIAAQWLGATVNSLFGETDQSDPPMLVTYQYMVSFIPDGAEVPTFGQAAQWIGEENNSSLFDAMVQYPFVECPTEVCKSLVWEGDPDLSGVGVMVVYYLAAAFATMYFVLLAADQFEPFHSMELHHKRWNWVVGAFHETVQAFLDTGLLFSVAMLVASVYRHGSSRLHPDKSHSIYELTNATYIGIFSLFPPVLLQIVTENKRRRRIRSTLWFVVIILAVALVALYYSLTTNASKVLSLLMRDSAIEDYIWEADCEPEDLRGALDDALITALVLLVVNFIPWIYHTVVPSRARHHMRNSTAIGRIDSRKPGRYGRTWWKNVIAITKTVDGILCCLVMWALLALYTAYRSAVLDRMGPENGNIEWSFAQVFALATWVPVAIDLVTIYMYGAQDALEGKVSTNYRVVEADNGDDGDEKVRKGSGGGGGGSGGGNSVVDYSNLDPYQVVDPENNQYNNQYGNNNGINVVNSNNGQFQGQYAGPYDPSTSKEAQHAEAQPMTTYMQPTPTYSNGPVPYGGVDSQANNYGYVPQDQGGIAHLGGGVHQQGGQQ